MNVNVCIGSACHIKGARQVVEQLQDLIHDNQVGDRVELRGVPCLGHCELGVCVDINGRIISVSPDKVSEFFKEEILAGL